MLINYLGKEELVKGRTVTGQYYTTLLDKQQFRKNFPEWLKKVLFYHDNGSVHSSAIIQKKLTELRFKILSHLSYSPDLTSSDFNLFRNSKLGGKKFQSTEKIVNGYFGDLEKSQFQKGIKKLEKRWTISV